MLGWCKKLGLPPSPHLWGEEEFGALGCTWQPCLWSRPQLTLGKRLQEEQGRCLGPRLAAGSKVNDCWNCHRGMSCVRAVPPALVADRDRSISVWINLLHEIYWGSRKEQITLWSALCKPSGAVGRGEDLCGGRKHLHLPDLGWSRETWNTWGLGRWPGSWFVQVFRLFWFCFSSPVVWNRRLGVCS